MSCLATQQLLLPSPYRKHETFDKLPLVLISDNLFNSLSNMHAGNISAQSLEEATLAIIAIVGLLRSEPGKQYCNMQSDNRNSLSIIKGISVEIRNSFHWLRRVWLAADFPSIYHVNKHEILDILLYLSFA